MSEAALTRAVVEALAKIPGVTAWRCNSGKVRVRGGFMQLAPNGTPDIIGYLSPNGRFFGIELKADHKDSCNCKHCSSQRVWATRAQADGVLYVKARTVAEALNFLTTAAVL